MKKEHVDLTRRIDRYFHQSDKTFAVFKLFASIPLGISELTKCTTALHVLDLMERTNCLGIGKYDTLKKILHWAELKDLREEVCKVEERINEINGIETETYPANEPNNFGKVFSFV